MKPTLFVSDLHLSPARPATLKAFEGFCAGSAREAAALYVLGDLFDSWIGDDQVRERLPGAAARALAGVAAAGVAVHVMPGNRDLLLGAHFAADAGGSLMGDEVVADIAGTPTLLLHGDTLCTGDIAYQDFRIWSHDPQRQRRFLALPYLVRKAVVAYVRHRSRRAKAQKTEVIMDVDPATVEAAFARYGVARIIHGHTHRPARHETIHEGRRCERWVLPDWYDTGGCLVVDGNGARFAAIPAAR
jgi:UDP-2,3-diacylglucosamine hydrolase